MSDSDAACSIEVHAIPVSGKFEAMTLSPTGRHLAVLTRDESGAECFRMYLIDTSTLACALELDLGKDHGADHPFCDATWSSDGSRVAVAYWGGWEEDQERTDVSIWIVVSATGMIQCEFTTEVPNVREVAPTGINGFTGLRWSADASRIAIDFHGGMWRVPNHWPFAVSVRDARDGDGIAKESWVPGPEGVLDSAMTRLFVSNEGDEGDGLLICDFDGNESLVDLGRKRHSDPALSEDETEVYVRDEESGAIAVVDVRTRKLRGWNGVDTARVLGRAAGDWSLSRCHWVDAEARQQDGSRAYRFDEERAAIIVLANAPIEGSAATPASDGFAQTLWGRRPILLELPER